MLIFLFSIGSSIVCLNVFIFTTFHLEVLWNYLIPSVVLFGPQTGKDKIVKNTFSSTGRKKLKKKNIGLKKYLKVQTA